MRTPGPTIKVDDEEISGLLELAEVVVAQKPPAVEVVPLEADDKKTRKMEAEQFKALLREQRAEDVPIAIGRAKTIDDPVTMGTLSAQMREPSATVPVTNAVMKDLVARAAEPAPPPRKPASTAELMAQVDEAFADFGPEPAAAEPASDAVPVAAPQIDSKPIKKPALVVPDHRFDTRFAGAIAPITKPPAMREARPPAPRAPSPLEVAPSPAVNSSTLILVSMLAVAIVVAIAFVLIR